MNKKLISEVMREMGRKGGKKGGKRRLETMTPEARSAVAKKAAAKSAEVRSARAKAKAEKPALKATKRTGPPPGWVEAKQKKELVSSFRKFHTTLRTIKRNVAAEQYERVVQEFSAAEQLLESGRVVEAEARFVSARGIALEHVTGRP